MKSCAEICDNIVLIGYMGAGKSRIGRELSQNTCAELNLELIDTDAYIVEKSGRTIADIFATDGEETFRNMETETLRELAGHRNMILSTGGGMPVRTVNRGLLKAIGRVVYLRAKVDTIVARVGRDNTRPLLAGEESLESKVTRMLKERGPAYEETADIIIDVDGKTPQAIAEEIINKL